MINRRCGALVERGKGRQAEQAAKSLEGFDWKTCKAFTKLKEHFRSRRFHDLKSIATIVSLKTDIKLDRLSQRDKRALYRWFDQNWDTILPHIKRMKQLDENLNELPLQETKQLDYG